MYAGTSFACASSGVSICTSVPAKRAQGSVFVLLYQGVGSAFDRARGLIGGQHVLLYQQSTSKASKLSTTAVARGALLLAIVINVVAVFVLFVLVKQVN